MIISWARTHPIPSQLLDRWLPRHSRCWHRGDLESGLDHSRKCSLLWSSLSVDSLLQTFSGDCVILLKKWGVVQVSQHIITASSSHHHHQHIINTCTWFESLSGRTSLDAPSAENVSCLQRTLGLWLDLFWPQGHWNWICSPPNKACSPVSLAASIPCNFSPQQRTLTREKASIQSLTCWSNATRVPTDRPEVSVLLTM